MESLARGWVLSESTCTHPESEMNLILMIVAPLPIGWFVRDRLTGYVAYLSLFSLVFTFQSVLLITEWAGGSKNAFGGFPKANKADVWSYGVVNLIFLVVGLGLLMLGQYLAARRRSRRVAPTAPSPVAV